MSRRLSTTHTYTLTQELALQEALALSECEVLAWRPPSATPKGQAIYLDNRRAELVTFCPTLAALRSLTALWAPQPYTMHISAQWDGWLCVLTRYPQP